MDIERQSGDVRDDIRYKNQHNYDKNLYKVGFTLLLICALIIGGFNLLFFCFGNKDGGINSLVRIGLIVLDAFFGFAVIQTIINLVKSKKHKDKTGYHDIIKHTEKDVEDIDNIEDDTNRLKARILYCPYCGTANRYDATTCKSCGGTFDLDILEEN